MSYKSSPRGSRPVDKIAIHTAEGSRTAASLGSYFWRDDIQASSHVGIDANNTLQYVPYDRAAWTLRSGNPISDNAEICGFAHWSREQWLSTGTVDGCVNPRAMLDRAAAWIRSRSQARGVPILKLIPNQVAAGWDGVIGHVDWTLGMGDGTHTDPGPNFPWDYVINKALSGSSPIIPEKYMKSCQVLSLPNTQLYQDKDEEGWVRLPFSVESGSNSSIVDVMWINIVSVDFGEGGNTEYKLWFGNDSGDFIGAGDGSDLAEDKILGTDFRQFVLKSGTRFVTLTYRNNGSARASISLPFRGKA